MDNDPYAEFTPADDAAPVGADPYAEFQAVPEPAKPKYDNSNQGGNDLQVFNPFGKNIDTHIPLGGDTNNALAGAGKAFSDTAAGVRQIALHIGNHLGLVPDSDVQENQDKIDEAKERDKPLMSTKAGMAGNIVGNIAPMALLPEAGIAGSALEGSALGAAQPVASDESRYQNIGMGAVGGAAGAAAGKLLSGALGGFSGPAERQAAADYLKAEGIPLSVAQQTGSKLAQHVERASAITGDAPAEFSSNQAQAFNRAVLRRVGVTDPDVTAATPGVLAPARDAITGTMHSVASKTGVNVDNQFLNDMASVESNMLSRVPASDAGPIRQNINDILANAANNNGSLDGTFYQKLRSNLTFLSQKPETAPVANDLREAVDNALERTASNNPDDLAALRGARSQYRALKQIEPAIDPATGNISPLKLINSMGVKSNSGQALYGRGDQSLMTLARAAKHILPDAIGNSGSAERMVAPLAALETLSSGKPFEAGTKALVGIGGLNAAGKALRNQGVVGNYLAKGLGPVGRAVAPVVGKSAAPLGYGAATAEESDRLQRASGGKVTDIEPLVTRLIGMVKQAKRASDKGTSTLLNVPDESIVKALDVAQQAI